MVEIGFRIQVICFCGFQNGEDDRTGNGTVLCVAEKPVLPADNDRADGIFHLVVADLNLAVFKECAKIRPLVKRVL